MNWCGVNCAEERSFSRGWRTFSTLGLALCGLLALSQGAGAQVQFVDVAATAGLDFRYVHGGTGQKYFIETMGPGCAFLDYDNDGFLDIYALNGHDLSGAAARGQTNVLYRNGGAGTFVEVTAAAGVGDRGYGVGVTVGDYDNDGDVDIYITNYGANALYRNEGTGAFVEVTAAAGVGDELWGAGCAFLDYDNDGFLDLYVANYVDYDLGATWKDLTPYAVASQVGAEERSNMRSYPSPDNFDGTSDVLYRNGGDGTFADVTAVAGVANASGKGMGVVCGDYDNDGDIDIFVANDQMPNFLYRNESDGTFVDVAPIAGVGYSGDGKLEASMGADFGDYDNDGLLDLVVPNFQREPTSLYRNEGDGLFEYTSMRSGLGRRTLPYVGWSTAFFDYDNDGLLDIFIANGHTLDNVKLFDASTSHPQRNQLFKNAGRGKFSEATGESGPGFANVAVSRGAVVGDYDNDGDVDLFVVNSDAPAQLLRNDGGNGQNWLQVRTVGTTGNRDGIGARLEISSGDLRQVREIKTGSGLYGQNDMRASFGLAASERVELIEVRWPSGVVDRIRDVRANRSIVIKEGTGE